MIKRQLKTGRDRGADIMAYVLDIELLQVVILVWLSPQRNLSPEKLEKASTDLSTEITSPLVTTTQKEGEFKETKAE